MIDRPPPRFYGVTTYIDPGGRFSFRFPTGWEQLDLEGREGVRFQPTPEDPEAHITAWVSKLEHSATAEDMPDLRAAVDEGIGQLPEAAVESATEAAYGNLLKFERVLTFREGEARRKRKTWIMYVDIWLIVMTYEGSSPEFYEYWLPMGNYAFATFNVPEALWFATDRDLEQVRQDLAAKASAGP